MIYVTLIAQLLFFHSGAQGSPGTLDIVSWNIAWFGSPTQAPPDDQLQEENVKKILRHLNADIYGLTEIVDTMRFRRVVDSLGPDFDYVIAPYASGNTTGTGASWLNAQKLAFIYRKSHFSNISTRGLLRSSAGNAYYNFASGRFPFMLSADVTVNGVTRHMNFILIHGKAGSTVTDYNRRLAAAAELKDTLDAYFSNSINLILGDFNDALEKTICNACGTSISSYDPIIRDSVDNDHYISITLPLGRAGYSSMTNFPNVIDHHIISDEAAPFYIPGSATIRTDVTNLVIFYGATTSDHYPVFSRYDLSGFTSITQVEPPQDFIIAFPNPFISSYSVRFKSEMTDVELILLDAGGRITGIKNYKRIPAGSILKSPLLPVQPGIYFLQIRSREAIVTIRLARIR